MKNEAIDYISFKLIVIKLTRVVLFKKNQLKNCMIFGVRATEILLNQNAFIYSEFTFSTFQRSEKVFMISVSLSGRLTML